MSQQWAVDRPKTLEEFKGQDAAVAFVRGLLKSKRIPGCIIISGPSGTGKTTLARIIAALFSGWKDDPNKNPDLNEASANVERGIDDVRALIDKSKFNPRGGKRRVILVDEAHSYAGPAAGALLKAVEEPPPKTTWIMCTDQPWKMPRQVAMRGQSIALDTVSDEILIEIMQDVLDKHKASLGKSEEAILNRLAQVAAGTPRIAVQLLDTVNTSIQGGGKPSEAIKMAIQSTPVAETFEASVKFLQAVLYDKIEDAIRVVGSAGSCDGMLELINKMLSALLFVAAGGKPKDGFGWKCTKDIGKITDTSKLLALQTRAVVALDMRVRSYGIPSESLLLTLARKL